MCYCSHHCTPSHYNMEVANGRCEDHFPLTNRVDKTLHVSESEGYVTKMAHPPRTMNSLPPLTCAK